MKKLTLYLLLILILFSCKQKTFEGIEIGSTLYSLQSVEENKKMITLISQTLNKNSDALIELINIDCGTSSGCYDLGFTITQLVYKINENEFFRMSEKLTKKQKEELYGYLSVGLKYYYEDKNIATEFPLLDKLLS